MKTIIGMNSYGNEMLYCGWDVINVSPGQVIVQNINTGKNHALPGPTKKGWRQAWDQWMAQLRRQVFKEPEVREFTEDEHQVYQSAKMFGTGEPLWIRWCENGIYYNIILSLAYVELTTWNGEKNKNYSMDFTPQTQEEGYNIARRLMRTINKYRTEEFKQIYPLVQL